jgi:hypothetical protein
MKKLIKMIGGSGPAARFGLLVVVLVTLCLGRSPLAHADTMLLATTTMVSGTSASSFSFNTPSDGIVTAQISSLPWPVPLSALSFSATTASDTLSSWSSSAPSSTPYIETFQVGAGTYFAHVMATAGGTLDLGLYSLMLTFTPSAVPLPAAAGMLLIGLLVLFALRRTMGMGDPAAFESNTALMAAHG